MGCSQSNTGHMAEKKSAAELANFQMEEIADDIKKPMGPGGAKDQMRNGYPKGTIDDAEDQAAQRTQESKSDVPEVLDESESEVASDCEADRLDEEKRIKAKEGWVDELLGYVPAERMTAMPQEAPGLHEHILSYKAQATHDLHVLSLKCNTNPFTVGKCKSTKHLETLVTSLETSINKLACLERETNKAIKYREKLTTTLASSFTKLTDYLADVRI